MEQQDESSEERANDRLARSDASLRRKLPEMFKKAASLRAAAAGPWHDRETQRLVSLLQEVAGARAGLGCLKTNHMGLWLFSSATAWSRVSKTS